MRFSRVLHTHDHHDPKLCQFVETADLDMLQLDYAWPHRFPPSGMYAPAVLRQLQTLHKTLFLDPKLRLVTDAGGGNPVGCAEAVAEFLCEHGDAELPMTAIRGDNLLPDWEQFLSSGIELRDHATGKPLHDLTQTPLAAHVELGAGPLLAALNEGSRVVIAGCYDHAAPAIASGMSMHNLSWDRVDDVSQLAVAAHLTETLLEFDVSAGTTIWAKQGEKLDGQHLDQRLINTTDDEGIIRHADVDCQLGQLELRETSPMTYCLKGIAGRANSGDWPLRLTFAAGYAAEALFECQEDIDAALVSDQLRALLKVEENPQRAIRLDALRTPDSETNSEEVRLIRVRCQSREREPSVEFVNEINTLVLQSRISGCELTGLPPAWKSETSQFRCFIPRDAIAVSVDTRAAKEWR